MACKTVCWILILSCHAVPAFAGGDFLGRQLPEILTNGWVDLSNPDACAPSLQSLRWQVVLIEIWQTDIDPCTARVPKLRALYEQHADAGLKILALSPESQSTVEGYAHLHILPYTVGFGLHSDWEITQVPDAYLVGVGGLVVWQGHPDELPTEVLEEELARVNRLPAIDDARAFRSALKDIDKGKLGRAHGKVAKLAKKYRDEPAVREQAEALLVYLERLAEQHRLDAQRWIEEDCYFEALPILEMLEDSFAGIDAAEEAEDTLKAWKKDKRIKNLLVAGKMLAAARDLQASERYEEAQQVLQQVAMGADSTLLSAEANRQLESLSQTMAAQKQNEE